MLEGRRLRNLNIPISIVLKMYTKTVYTVMLLVTVTGWYCTNCPMHCGHFLIYCVSPSEF
jgi:hypothetical protein